MSRMLSALKKQMKQNGSNDSPSGLDPSANSAVSDELERLTSAEIVCRETSADELHEPVVIVKGLADLERTASGHSSSEHAYAAHPLDAETDLTSPALQAHDDAAEAFTQIVAEPSNGGSNYGISPAESEPEWTPQVPQSRDDAPEMFARVEAETPEATSAHEIQADDAELNLPTDEPQSSESAPEMLARIEAETPEAISVHEVPPEDAGQILLADEPESDEPAPKMFARLEAEIPEVTSAHGFLADDAEQNPPLDESQSDDPAPELLARFEAETPETTSAQEIPADDVEQNLSSDDPQSDEPTPEMFARVDAETSEGDLFSDNTFTEQGLPPGDPDLYAAASEAFARILAESTNKSEDSEPSTVGPGQELPADDPEAYKPAEQLLTGFMVSRDADPGRISPQFEEQIHSTLAKTSASEQYRQMKEAILAHLPHASSSVMSFVGVEANADIADIVAHTSVLFANDDDFRVLLLDAEFSHKTLSARFGLNGSKGLAEVLVEESSFSDVIRTCNTTGLSFMPAGAGLFPRQPSAIRRLPGIVDQLRRQFSVVCVDGGGADQSSARSLARWCDTVYFVLPLGKHTPDEVTVALDCLRAHGARLLGSVLTRIPIDVAPADSVQGVKHRET